MKSLLVEAYYTDSSSHELKKLFFKRSIRQLKTGAPGINYKGKVYPVLAFKKDNKLAVEFDINIDKNNLQLSVDCPILFESEALELIENVSVFLQKESQQESQKQIDSPPFTDDQNLAKQDLKVPDEVFTDIFISKIQYENESFDIKQLNRIYYKSINVPEFGKDWFIERTDWYAYVLVNNDSVDLIDENDEVFQTITPRLDTVSDILENPNYYSLPRAAYIKELSYSHEHDAFNKARLLGEVLEYTCKTPFKEVMTNVPVELEKDKTFYEKWGKIEFEERASVRPSTNNIQYDHWFRFDLSISDETLKKIFTDIFEIYDWEGINIALEPVEYRSLPLILDRYLTQPRVSKEKPIYKKTSLDDETEEWVDVLEKEVDVLEKENTEINQEIQKLKAVNNELNSDKNKLTNQITELTKQINNFKSNESKRIEEDLRLFKKIIIFLPNGIKTLKGFSKPDKFYEILLDLILDEVNLPKKKAERTDSWLEIDKKISTGTDDQGRIYYTRTGRDDRKFMVLFGHKQNQKQDIEYLRKDHRKDLDM